MRFEINFNEKKHREQSKIYFDLAWENLLKKNRKVLYFVLFYFISGIFIIYGKSNFGYLFIIFGIHFLINYYYFYKHYTNNNKKYFKLVEKCILDYNSNNQLSILEFKEDIFCYTDYKLDLKVNWSLITNYKVFEKNLFIELKNNLNAVFFINEEEVGEENFNKIILFLEDKIKNN